MFLKNIINVNFNKKNLIFYYKFFLLKIEFLNKIIQKKNIYLNFFKFNFFFFNFYIFKFLYFDNISFLIDLILKINKSKSNIFINLTSITGSSITILHSGLLKFKGSNKIKKLALSSLIKKLNFYLILFNNKNTIIQFKGLKINKKFIYNKIKNFLLLKSIFNNNLKPFNGCKPKKLKNKKYIKILEEMTERLKVIDCKSIGLFHRKFKSYFLHLRNIA